MKWCTPVIFAIFVIISDYLTFGSSKFDHKVYIKATKCTGIEKFFYKNISCYAKSSSRTYSASFMYMLAKAPIVSHFKVRIFVIGFTFKLFVFNT